MCVCSAKTNNIAQVWIWERGEILRSAPELGYFSGADRALGGERFF